MAEEGTLGLARAPARERLEPSKEELQRRMEQARDSISQTVTEIKETVAQQVESVKDALDWREQVKKRPVAWSLGAAGAGFLVGYGIAVALEGEGEKEFQSEYRSVTPHVYAAQPVLGESRLSGTSSAQPLANGDGKEAPGLLERFRETSAYDRLSKEVASLGDRVIDELSTTAQQVVLPALLGKIKNWIGLDLADKRQPRSLTGDARPAAGNPSNRNSTYQPTLERSN